MNFVGFKPLKAGRIHLYCPSCKRKLSNTRRTDYDPPTAVLAHLACERCSEGCKVDGESKYMDARGRSIYFENGKWVVYK